MDRINRRQFAGCTAAGIAATLLGMQRRVLAEEAEEYSSERPLLVTGRKLAVQPVLIYRTFERRDASSWRSWGSVNTAEAAAEERQRIERELAALSGDSDFPWKSSRLQVITSEEEAARVHNVNYDVVLVYPATGARSVLLACFAAKQPRDTLIFARHRSGPVYYWYEALSTSFPREGNGE